MTLDSLQSAFDIFHNTAMNIVEPGDYDDYENTYGSNKIIGTVTGDLQPYSGGLAEKEYGLTVECQYAFYCHTDSRIKEGVYLQNGNNFYEVVYAARWNMGLPTIVDVTGGLSSMAQGLASASDGTKKFVVGAGAAVVGLGALSKGVAGTVKTVGGIIESVGTIKKAFAKGGALAKFAPTLTAIGSAAGPATIGIAATAAATVGLYEAAKAYEEYKSDWSRGGEEMATAIRSHAEATRELNDLQYELRSLQQVVNNPETDESTLNSSKARIEEIKQLLSEKYNLDITVNDSELDAAIEKAKQLQLLETKQQIPDLLDYADNGKDDYNQALKDQELYRSNIEGIKQQQEATKNFRGELLLLDDAYKKGNISQEEYTNAFNKLVEATGNPNFKDTPLDVLLNSDAIDDWSKRLEENLTKNNRLLAESESKTAESTQAMQDLANAGLLELEFGDAEQGLSHIATAVKSADLSMMDWAATAALVQTGQKSLDDVWKQGGDVLDNYVANYISDYPYSAKQPAVTIGSPSNTNMFYAAWYKSKLFKAIQKNRGKNNKWKTKYFTGTVNSTQNPVQSENKRLLLDGDLLVIQDKIRDRIRMGNDTVDGKKQFVFTLYDVNGNPVVHFDENGNGIFSGTIRGGRIEADTDIAVDRDAFIGQTLMIGYQSSYVDENGDTHYKWYEDSGIRMSGYASISTNNNGENLVLGARTSIELNAHGKVMIQKKRVLTEEDLGSLEDKIFQLEKRISALENK